MPFKKQKTTWTSELEESLIQCYSEALENTTSDSSVTQKCFQLFSERVGDFRANIANVKSKIHNLRRKFPQRVPTIAEYSANSVREQDSCDDVSELTPRQNRKWTSSEIRRLWELASSVFHEEQLRLITGFYEGNIGRHAGLYTLLRDVFINDQELTETITIGAIRQAFKRAMQIYGEIEPNPMLTAAEVEEATSANLINQCFESENKFAKQKVFDSCCAVCSCLLWGEFNHGHKFSCQAERRQADVTLHYNADELLPFQYRDKEERLMWFLCKSCDKHRRGQRVCEVFDFYSPTGVAKRPIELCPAGKELSMHAKQQIALVRFVFCVTKRSVPQAHSYHINRGYVKPKMKPTKLNFLMYGFVSSNPKLIEKLFIEADRETIKTALLWLKRNNPLYKEFFANVETIFQYSINNTVDLYKIPFAKYASGRPIEYGSEQDLLHVFATSDLPEPAEEDDTFVGIQHLRDSAKRILDVTRVKFNDPNREAKAYGYLLPYGKGGFSKGHGIARNEYIKNRLGNWSPRFRRCRHWLYNQINEQGLDVYYFTKRKHIASNKGRDKNITAADVMRGKNERNIEVGTAMRISIPGTQEFWHAKLYDLMAMVSKKATQRPEKPYPDLFVTITLNEGWPEIQALVCGGLREETNVPDNPLDRTYNERKPATHMAFEVTVAAQKRLLFILKEIKKRRIFGEVEDYVIRAEYQNRGAIHWHILFWIKLGTLPSDVVSAEMPRGTDANSQHLRQLVSKFQIHGCLSSRCKMNRKNCKYGFPFATNQTLHLHKSGKRFVYVRRENEDVRVVPYNAALLVLARAHVNVQLCTQKEMYSYLMRYQMKFYSHKIQVVNTTEQDSFVRMRDISIMEANHQALQFPAVMSTMEVVYLPTDFIPNTKVLKSDREIEIMFAQNPESEEVFCTTKMEHYMARPNELESVSYTEFYEKYRFQYQTGSTVGLPNRLNPKQIIVRRTKEAATRYYLKSIMKNVDEYCLQQLILHVPFRKFSDLFSESNTSQSPIKEVVTTHKDNPKINLGHKEKFGVHYLESAKRRLFSFESLQTIGDEMVQKGFLKSDIFKSWLSKLTKETVIRDEWMRDNPFDHKDKPESAVPSAADLTRTKGKLKGKQGCIYQLIEDWCKNENRSQEDPFRYFITGGAGVGKTTLMKGVVELFKAYGVVCQTLATTGVASKVCDGTTVHHFFKLNLRLKSNIDPSGMEARIIRSVEVLIIDEVSMMSGGLFRAMDFCLQRYENPKLTKQKHMFGGRSVILVGDPAQLPVINAKGIWCETKFYEHFHVYNLEQIKRTADERFMSILGKIRLGIVDEHVDYFLKEKEIQLSELKYDDYIKDPDAVFIVPKKNARDEFNKAVIERLIETTNRCVHRFPAVNIENNSEPMSVEKVQRCLKYTKSMLPEELNLVVGCKVILLKNLDVGKGWCNGSLAIVVGITDDTVCIRDIKDPKKMLLVLRFEEDITIPGEPVRCARIQFPLDLAYALTMHKCQGMTIKRVAVNMADPWQSGQVYVAISRSSHPDLLQIINYRPEKIILSAYYADILQWITYVDRLGRFRQYERPMPMPPKTGCQLPAEQAKLKDLHARLNKSDDSEADDSDTDDAVSEEGEIVLSDEEGDERAIAQKSLQWIELPMSSQLKRKFSNNGDDEQHKILRRDITKDGVHAIKKPPIALGEAYQEMNEVFEDLIISKRTDAEMLQAQAQISQSLIPDTTDLRGRSIRFLQSSLELLQRLNNPHSDAESSLERYCQTDGSQKLERDIFYLLFNKDLFSDTSVTSDSAVCSMMANVHSCFNRHFVMQDTPPDGNCFYHAVSQSLFGNHEFYMTIKAGCLFAYVRHLRHFKRVFGDSPAELIELWKSIATERIWASDLMFPLAALTIGRPIHVFSVNNIYAPGTVITVPSCVQRKTDSEFLNYCANEDKLVRTLHLSSFVYASPWNTDDGSNPMSRRTPIRLVHTGTHFVNMIPRDNPIFDLRCNKSHFSGQLARRGAGGTEDQKEVDFIESVINRRYND